MEWLMVHEVPAVGKHPVEISQQVLFHLAKTQCLLDRKEALARIGRNTRTRPTEWFMVHEVPLLGKGLIERR